MMTMPFFASAPQTPMNRYGIYIRILYRYSLGLLGVPYLATRRYVPPGTQYPAAGRGVRCEITRAAHSCCCRCCCCRCCRCCCRCCCCCCCCWRPGPRPPAGQRAAPALLQAAEDQRFNAVLVLHVCPWPVHREGSVVAGVARNLSYNHSKHSKKYLNTREQ